MLTSTRRAIRNAGTVVTVMAALLTAAATAAPGAAALPGDPYTCDTWSVSFAPSHSQNMRVSAKIPYSNGIYSEQCTLVKNDRGSGVTALQLSLKNCYRQAIAVDGSFGPATFTALKNAQRSLGLSVDGAYGYYTSRAMKFPYFTPTGAFYNCH
ncbi:peptidoglycan-binding domain-containing protein [Streptomyces parvus]|uniref:Peptidoglycan-binding protein n=1 Tax=Streptomyces parvus TaxID=66428 RepID=A0A7K3S9U6_9ACTN|nr:peptidoglycan-binding domain-containing protein [Streptomyces parvus]NEC24251.1 peptidoglycan-binding protein [Streptomyces parvus]